MVATIVILSILCIGQAITIYLYRRSIKKISDKMAEQTERTITYLMHRERYINYLKEHRDDDKDTD